MADKQKAGPNFPSLPRESPGPLFRVCQLCRHLHGPDTSTMTVLAGIRTVADRAFTRMLFATVTPETSTARSAHALLTGRPDVL